MSAALEIEGVVGGYASADHVVKGVSVRVAAGEWVAVIGPNGAGKSTLLKLAAGLLVPREGRVRLAGTESPHLPAALRISRLAASDSSGDGT